MRFCTLTVPDENKWDEKRGKMIRKPKYYHSEESIENLLKYAVRFKENGEGVAYYDVMNLPRNDLDEAALEILKVQKCYGKDKGRRMYQFILSFCEKVEPLDVYWAGTVIAFEMFRDCQMLYAVHTGTENIHIHFVFSSVKANGRKCDYSGRKFTEMKEGIERIAYEFFHPTDGHNRVYSYGSVQSVNMGELLADIRRICG